MGLPVTRIEKEFILKTITTNKIELEVHSIRKEAKFLIQEFDDDTITLENIKKEKSNVAVKFFKYVIYLPFYTFFNIYLRHKGYVDSWQGLLFAKLSALHFPIAFIKSLQLVKLQE